jgi:hypothetical protein
MSYRPLVLYDPDSDSDTDSLASLHGAPMGVANDMCGDDSDGFSLNSNLMEEVSDDEFDDPALRPRTYNPLGLRVEAGKRVGYDSDDSSDGDGDHLGQDRDYSYPSKQKIFADIDEKSVGSDDEFTVGNSMPPRITKNDKQFDTLIPTSGSVHALSSADQPANIMQEAEHEKGKAMEEKQGKRLGRAGKQAESKRLVAESLAKARSAKGAGAEVAKQYYEGKAKQEGEKLMGGKLSPATKAKGKEALLKAASVIKAEKSIAKGKLAQQLEPDLKEKIGEAKTKKAKAAVTKEITQAGKSKGMSKLAKKLVKTRDVLETAEKGKARELMTKVNRVMMSVAMRKLMADPKKTAGNLIARKLIKLFREKGVQSKQQLDFLSAYIKEKMERERAGLSAEELRVATAENLAKGGGEASEASTMVGGATQTVMTNADDPKAPTTVLTATTLPAMTKEVKSTLVDGINLGNGKVLAVKGKTLTLDGEAIKSGTSEEALAILKALDREVKSSIKDPEVLRVLVGTKTAKYAGGIITRRIYETGRRIKTQK